MVSPAEAIVKAVAQGGSRWGGRHPLFCTVWDKKARKNARSWLHPEILQCLQRNNLWELSGQAAQLCLSFPRCKMWMKTLEGNFLALGWAWGFIDRGMGGGCSRCFSPLCYEIILQTPLHREKSQPRSTFAMWKSRQERPSPLLPPWHWEWQVS